MDNYKLEIVRDHFSIGWGPDTFHRLPRGGIEQTRWEDFMFIMQDLQLKPRPDKLGWNGDVSDTFFVSSDRDFIDSSMLDVTGLEIRWNNWVPIKINILIWRINHLGIPTWERLSHRGIDVDVQFFMMTWRRLTIFSLGVWS